MTDKKTRSWGAKAFPDVVTGATELGASGGIQKGSLKKSEKHLDEIGRQNES